MSLGLCSLKLLSRTRDTSNGAPWDSEKMWRRKRVRVRRRKRIGFRGFWSGKKSVSSPQVTHGVSSSSGCTKCAETNCPSLAKAGPVR